MTITIQMALVATPTPHVRGAAQTRSQDRGPLI